MVDRCVCFDNTFADMKMLIDKNGIDSIHELKRFVPFGENCGLCRPYVEMVIKTGKTSFDVINFDSRNP